MLIKLAFKKLHLSLHLTTYFIFITFRERFLNFMLTSHYFSNGYIVMTKSYDLELIKRDAALKGSFNALSDYDFKKVRSL